MPKPSTPIPKHISPKIGVEFYLGKHRYRRLFVIPFVWKLDLKEINKLKTIK